MNRQSRALCTCNCCSHCELATSDNAQRAPESTTLCDVLAAKLAACFQPHDASQLLRLVFDVRGFMPWWLHAMTGSCSAVAACGHTFVLNLQ